MTDSNRPWTTYPIETAAGRRATEALWNLKKEARGLTNARYSWLCDVRGLEFVSRWKTFEADFQTLHNKSEQIITSFNQEDEVVGAWLKAKLLDDESFSGSKNFSYDAHFTYGDEKLRLEVVGKEASQSSTAQDLNVDHSYLSSLRKGYAVDLSVPLDRPSITLGEALQQKLWVLWNRPPSGQHEGFAFCITCPCPRIVSSTHSENPKEAFFTVPRYFHSDPLFNDAALRHIRAVHQDPIVGGTSELLLKYAIRGRLIATLIYNKLYTDIQPVRGDLNRPLDKWAVAANNFAAQQWFEEYSSEWNTIRKVHRPIRKQQQPPHSHIVPVRIIQPDILRQAHVFRMQQHSWVILCPNPDCDNSSFEDGPWSTDAIIEHFRSYYCYVQNESELKSHFGIQSKYLSKSRSLTE